MMTNKQTPLEIVVGCYEDKMMAKWKPSKKFYKTVGINQKRFGMILRGELPMYDYEVTSLASFFGVPVNELLPSTVPVA